MSCQFRVLFTVFIVFLSTIILIVLISMSIFNEKPLMPETRIIIGKYQFDDRSFHVVFIFDIHALNQSDPMIETSLRHYWDSIPFKPLREIDIEKVIENYEVEKFGGHGLELSLIHYLIKSGIPACTIVFDTPMLPVFDPHRAVIGILGGKPIDVRPLLNGKVYFYTMEDKLFQTEFNTSQLYAQFLREYHEIAVESFMVGNTRVFTRIATGHGATTRIISCELNYDGPLGEKIIPLLTCQTDALIQVSISSLGSRIASSTRELRRVFNRLLFNSPTTDAVVTLH